LRYLRARRRRHQLRLTIFELAQICKVSALTVRLWERGLATPNPAHRKALERALGRSWDWLRAMERPHA